MTASEHLTRLHATGDPWFAHNLLPALAAVVAAAEKAAVPPYDEVMRGRILRHACSNGEITQFIDVIDNDVSKLSDALAELNRVLGDKP